MDAARDAAFAHYGRVRRFAEDGARCTATLKPRLPVDGVGLVGELEAPSLSALDAVLDPALA